MDTDRHRGADGALRFLLAGAGIGVAIPLLLRLASAAMDSLAAVPVGLLTALDYATLMLWPTTLLLVPVEEPGAPDLSSWGSVAIAMLANVTVYAALAGLVWAGLAKARWILAIPVLVVAGVWFIVWRT
jgi:hypothetical protein